MAKKRTRKSVKVKEQAVLRLLKTECLWIEHFQDVEHARDIVGRWMETYNNQWLIERHGHRTPREVRQTQEESQSAVA